MASTCATQSTSALNNPGRLAIQTVAIPGGVHLISSRVDHRLACDTFLRDLQRPGGASMIQRRPATCGRIRAPMSELGSRTVLAAPTRDFRNPPGSRHRLATAIPNRAAVEDRWSVVKRVLNEAATRPHNLDQKISGGPRSNPKPCVPGGSPRRFGRLFMIGMCGAVVRLFPRPRHNDRPL